MVFRLFTVTIELSDGTYAIEQVEAISARESLATAIRNAKAFESKTQAEKEQIVLGATHVHPYRNTRGAWIWLNRSDDPRVSAEVVGGMIVQTDADAACDPDRYCN
jgi:hypothetical protein